MNRPSKKEQQYTLHSFNHLCMLGVILPFLPQITIYDAGKSQEEPTTTGTDLFHLNEKQRTHSRGRIVKEEYKSNILPVKPSGEKWRKLWCQRREFIGEVR